MTEARYQHAAVRIPYTLSVVVFGGQGVNGQALASAEQLNYTTQNWTAVVSPSLPAQHLMIIHLKKNLL